MFFRGMRVCFVKHGFVEQSSSKSIFQEKLNNVFIELWMALRILEFETIISSNLVR